MTGDLLSAAVLVVGIGATGWCVWHCLRTIGAMRRGRAAASCCPSTGSSRNTSRQLADLRAEVAELRSSRRDDSMAR